MQTANVSDLKLIRKGEKIPSDILENFPFWIASGDMDTDQGYWPEAEPPEGADFDHDEGWIKFPEDFFRQRLLFGEESGFEIWTPDWIELSQKHNGILFVVEGFNEIEKDWVSLLYPSVHIHLRFKSELNRMAAIRDIRRDIREQAKDINVGEHQDDLTLFLGQYPEGFLEVKRDRVTVP